MMTFDSIYREEDGHVLIEMSLSSVIQLFNTFDPAPFHEKEMDINAENYIVDTVKDFPGKTDFKIVFYLPDNILDTKEAMEIPRAIRAHFEYKTLMQRRKLRERYIYGQFTFIVGVSFLALATVASLAIDTYYGSYPVAHLIAEIVGNPAIRVHVEEMLPQAPGQEPGCNRKILVMAAGEMRAILPRFVQRGSAGRNRVAGGEPAPAQGCRIVRSQLSHCREMVT
jgi:hypothetical protein